MDAPFVEGEDNSLLDVLENDSTPATGGFSGVQRFIEEEIGALLALWQTSKPEVIKLAGLETVERRESAEHRWQVRIDQRKYAKSRQKPSISAQHNSNKLLKRYLVIWFGLFWGSI